MEISAAFCPSLFVYLFVYTRIIYEIVISTFLFDPLSRK